MLDNVSDTWEIQKFQIGFSQTYQHRVFGNPFLFSCCYFYFLEIYYDPTGGNNEWIWINSKMFPSVCFYLFLFIYLFKFILNALDC